MQNQTSPTEVWGGGTKVNSLQDLGKLVAQQTQQPEAQSDRQKMLARAAKARAVLAEKRAKGEVGYTRHEKPKKAKKVVIKSWDEFLAGAPEIAQAVKPTQYDNVNNPKHYTTGGIETIDFIEAKQLTYNLGNVVKYITRAGVKNAATHIEDLEKAAWYLNREIQNLKKGV